MIRKMTIQDAHLPLHPRNRKELIAQTGREPNDVLEIMYVFYRESYVYESEDGVVCCMFGIHDGGEFYMFFTEIDSLPMSFYKDILRYKKKFLKRYGKICADIMVSNTFALELAKFMKAEIGEPWEKNGETFVSFVIRK